MCNCFETFYSYFFILLCFALKSLIAMGLWEFQVEPYLHSEKRSFYGIRLKVKSTLSFVDYNGKEIHLLEFLFILLSF